MPKKIERGDSLVSPDLVCYAEKQVKPFWFSSLDQIVHFGAIIFCRTFVELFWSVRVDRKKKSHYNSRVSLHEAPTKKKSHYNSRVSLHEAPTKNAKRSPFILRQGPALVGTWRASSVVWVFREFDTLRFLTLSCSSCYF